MAGTPPGSSIDDMELRRVENLPDFVFDIVDRWKAEAAARGDEIIDFGIGSPDVGTADPVVDRLVAAARDPRQHGYPTSAGLPQPRAALAAWYERRYGVAIDPDSQALITWGASEALTHLPWVLLGPGDTALVPGPCYPIHHYAVLFSGATPIPVPMFAPDGGAAAGGGAAPVGGTTPVGGTIGETGANAGRGSPRDALAQAGDPEPDALAQAGDTDAALFDRLAAAFAAARPRPRVLLLSFPHNPTTRCVDLPFLERVVDFARRNDAAVIHDFAYGDIAFDGFRPPSILEVPGAADVAVELLSLSKSHDMAGWRLGFVAGNARLISGLRRLKSYLDYGVTLPIQTMALAALAPESDAAPPLVAERYRRRRDLLCDGLTAIGWPVFRPRGSMFVWARLPQALRARGSLAAAEHLLRHAHVAVSPGIGFGELGEGHVRFALVQPEDRIRVALAGIAAALRAAG
jgi:alanine-synthesizing transaminase